MNNFRTKICRLVLLASALLCGSTGAWAQERELYWDGLDVEARLNADGILDVVERHTMVFTGEWNGGERVFKVQPRERLEFLGLERMDVRTGALQPLQETSVPSNVDEFTWSDKRTLRWRSRLTSDPPFANTRLVYVLRYRLSGILFKDDAQYSLVHDFAFPDRSGPIHRFTLNLDLDPAWQPPDDFQKQYTAGPLEVGQSFVLNLPFVYAGSIEPQAIDKRRPTEVVVAVMAILGGLALMLLVFVVRERSLGRFAPVDTAGIDNAWIEKNILSHPAEVVGAVWDGHISTSEVVALIARMTAEGKLESSAEEKSSMRLRLKVDRDELRPHERALIDGLFIGHQTETSTSEVKEHYKGRGFDPATVIRPELQKLVEKVLPPGRERVGWLAGVMLFAAAAVLLMWTVFSDAENAGPAIAFGIFSLIFGSLLQIPGWLFRSRPDWGHGAAALLVLPAVLVSLGTAAVLWRYAGPGAVELPWTVVGALAVLSIWISSTSINGMKSRQSREAIAFRKRLATGRSFFVEELEKAQPNLQDSWYPWLLAFGLGKQVDVWSSQHAGMSTGASTWTHSTSRSSTSSSSSSTSMGTGWSGGGGLSGGAGASGTWAAAAAGMAAGVAAPSSSSSGGRSSSSSSGGSSGGGGGGGW